MEHVIFYRMKKVGAGLLCKGPHTAQPKAAAFPFAGKRKAGLHEKIEIFMRSRPFMK